MTGTRPPEAGVTSSTDMVTMSLTAGVQVFLNSLPAQSCHAQGRACEMACPDSFIYLQKKHQRCLQKNTLNKGLPNILNSIYVFTVVK
jgi:hypothetical protein